MSEKHIEVCPACGVTIENGDKVLFSVGPPGNRSRLWARVCQFAKKPGCINQDQDAVGTIQSNDYYGDVNDPLASRPQSKSAPKPEPKSLSTVVGKMLESQD